MVPGTWRSRNGSPEAKDIEIKEEHAAIALEGPAARIDEMFALPSAQAAPRGMSELRLLRRERSDKARRRRGLGITDTAFLT
jgi:hypothetical protein